MFKESNDEKIEGFYNDLTIIKSKVYLLARHFDMYQLY
jgi:hypothetical protein